MSFITALNNQIIKLATKYYRVVIIVVILLIALICYFTFLGPKISKIREYRVFDYKKKQSELTERQQYLADLKVLNDHYNQWQQEELEKIEKVLPSTEDYPSIFAQYEKLISDAGYNLTDISIYKSAETSKKNKADTFSLSSGNIGVLNIQISVSAPEDYGYDNFKTLLNTIENNLRLIDVTSLSFEPNRTSFRLSLKTYYLSS